MLTMHDIKYIRRLYEKEECSIREIMRRTGYHYRTVKKYITMEDFNEYLVSSRSRSSKLDPFKNIIDRWLIEDRKAPRKQRHTAKRVYDRLNEECGTTFTASLRTVQLYVSEKKKALKIEKTKGFIELKHPPGEGQVDFRKVSYYNSVGTLVSGSKLTVSFPYSNASFTQLFKGENQECLLEGLELIFRYINKVPIRLVFDNLSAAVINVRKGAKRKLTERFSRFMEHYNIEPVFCNPASGWEKGHVENKVGYTRRNLFVPIPHIENLEDFNITLLERCTNDMNRIHYKKKIEILKLFEDDLEHMNSLNSKRYDVQRIVTVKADKYGKISFETNKYSMTPSYAQEQLILKITHNKVCVLNKAYEEIITHERSYDKDTDVYNWTPYIPLIARRPNALKYSGFYDELPSIWKGYLDSLELSKKKQSLQTLHKILNEHDMNTAVNSLELLLSNGLIDNNSLIASYHSVVDKNLALSPLQLENILINTPEYEIDTKEYDRLLKGVGLGV